MGATGAGKTTLLRVLAGLEPSFRGRITFCDAVWSDSADASAGFIPPHQRRVGVAFQDSRLLPARTVRGNLVFAMRRARGGGLTLAFARRRGGALLGGLTGTAHGVFVRGRTAKSGARQGFAIQAKVTLIG